MSQQNARVLRACEAVAITGPDQVQCGNAATWWEAPNGKSYLLCDHHLALFGRLA